MDTSDYNANYQALAERAQVLVTTTNQLIADIECDIAAPADAAFHAKDAYAGLCRAHNALLDAFRDRAHAMALGAHAGVA